MREKKRAIDNLMFMREKKRAIFKSFNTVEIGEKRKIIIFKLNYKLL